MKQLLRYLLMPFVNHTKKTFFFLFVLFIMALILPVLRDYSHPIRYLGYNQNIMKVKIPYQVGSEAAEEILEVPRGASLRIEQRGDSSSVVEYKGKTFEIDNKYLKTTIEECIKTDYIYPRRLLNLQTDRNGKLSETVVKKAEKVKVINVNIEDFDRKTGQIHWYQVEKGNKKYWIPGDYVELSKKAANKDYSNGIKHSTYWDDEYGKGYSKDAYIKQVDYKPQPVIQYENNPLPEEVNAVHVSLDNYVNNKEYYLNLNKTTGINSIVLAIKGDGGYLFYDSDVVKEYLDKPDAALHTAIMSKDELTKIIDELHEHDYYVIARVVTFKDSIFAKQNKDAAITKKGSKSLYELNDEYWPSVYSRKAWMYNVDIAKEIASCHVNEIQFDYCRFPDGTATVRNKINMKNTYNESKVAAIQGFFMYAKTELSQYEVYVAADVFAWPVIADDDQDIGQYFPAIINIVDVICPMPYADLFSEGAMGIKDPVKKPKETLFKFSEKASMVMKEMNSNAQYRTWIMAYYPYEAKEIIQEIKGINEAGFQGYLIWYGNGEKRDLQTVEDGFISSKIEN